MTNKKNVAFLDWECTVSRYTSRGRVFSTFLKIPVKIPVKFRLALICKCKDETQQTEFFRLLNTKQRLPGVSALVAWERRHFTCWPLKVKDKCRGAPPKCTLSFSLSQSAVPCRSHDYKEMKIVVTLEGYTERNTTSVIDQLRVSTCEILFFLAQYSVFPTEKGWFQHCVADLKSYSDLLTFPILTEVVLAKVNIQSRVSSHSCR